MCTKPVRAAVASDAAPKYERKPAGPIVDAVEPKIREQLALDARTRGLRSPAKPSSR
jgi:hypothetical protein